MRILRKSFIILVSLLIATGCSTVHRSRVVLDKTSTMPGGMVVSNFPIEEVDTFVQYFVSQKGYEIRFAESSDPLVQKELENEDYSLIWIAEKPDEPVILFISSGKELIVSILQVSWPLAPADFKEYSNVLYMLLRDKFGEENVHMVK